MKKSLPPLVLSVGLLILLGASFALGACLSVRNVVPTEAVQTDTAHSETAAAHSETVTSAASFDGGELPAAADIVSATEVRQAVTRALPYLEQQGVAWMNKHKCVSCHQVPSMLWSYNEAAAHGLPVDRAKLDEWNRWSLEKSMEAEVDNSDGFHQMILGRPSGLGDDLIRDYESLAGFIAEAQESDGSWKAGGQLPLQRRPEDESHRVSTVWSLLALASIASGEEALERGRGYLEAALAESGQSHEWLIVRLLYEHHFGNKESVRELLSRVLDEQNADGGWAWIRGEPSDAFATGQTLYALERLDWPTDEATVERAREFLLETQRDDGSWQVRSTLKREPGPMPTSNFWGTGWAVIGLLRSLPEDGVKMAGTG